MRHFTIRDLVWLTLAVGLGLSWWIDSASREAEKEYWIGKANALAGALESREELIGWEDLDTAAAILNSPTNTVPTVSHGRFDREQ